MDIFFQQVVNGLSLGAIYVLVAVGITLIFGVSRLVNFAHGQFLVLGSFITYSLVASGLGFWIAMPIAAVSVGLAGVLTDRGLLRWTIDRPINGFIVSLGLVIALEGLFVEVWSADQYKVPTPVSGVLSVGSVRIPLDRILTFGIGAVSVVLLYLILKRTDSGRAMRATAENRDAAGLVGVSVGRSISTSFFLGALLAGVGGAFLGALFPFSAFSGGGYLVKGLAVALIGGLGSIEGAVLVGLGLGLLETLGSAYGIGGQWRDGYAFAAMVVLLAWRPRGLFGRTREY
jgi:branched-chain amino acid transport system permease protein